MSASSRNCGAICAYVGLMDPNPRSSVLLASYWDNESLSVFKLGGLWGSCEHPTDQTRKVHYTSKWITKQLDLEFGAE